MSASNNSYGATEEKSSREGPGKKLTAMQKTFIKSSIDMRRRGKSPALFEEPKDTLVDKSMENEVMVYNEEDYEQMLQDIEHPAS